MSEGSFDQLVVIFDRTLESCQGLQHVPGPDALSAGNVYHIA